MTWRDRTFNPIKSLLCFIGIAFAAALIMTGMDGAIWGVVEMVKQITTWVL